MYLVKEGIKGGKCKVFYEADLVLCEIAEFPQCEECDRKHIDIGAVTYDRDTSTLFFKVRMFRMKDKERDCCFGYKKELHRFRSDIKKAGYVPSGCGLRAINAAPLGDDVCSYPREIWSLLPRKNEDKDDSKCIARETRKQLPSSSPLRKGKKAAQRINDLALYFPKEDSFVIYQAASRKLRMVTRVDISNFIGKRNYFIIGESLP